MLYVLPNVGVEYSAPLLLGHLYGFMGVGPTLHLGPGLKESRIKQFDTKQEYYRGASPGTF